MKDHQAKCASYADIRCCFRVFRQHLSRTTKSSCRSYQLGRRGWRPGLELEPLGKLFGAESDCWRLYLPGCFRGQNYSLVHWIHGQEPRQTSATWFFTPLSEETIRSRRCNPVKLKGVSNPIISLTNKKVCPTQPLSITNPCVIRLDPITLTPSTLSDYYLVMYFGNNSNNAVR